LSCCGDCEERELAGWSRIKAKGDGLCLMAIRFDFDTHVNRRPVHKGNYMVLIPKLGHHFYVTAEQFEENFTVEGPRDAG
jgi:hypothetical protein